MVQSKAVEFKGGSVTLMTLHLMSTDPAKLALELEDRISQAPKFFKHAPVIVDVCALDIDTNADQLAALVETIKASDLQPIAARSTQDSHRDMLNDLGLPTLRRHQADEMIASEAAEAPGESAEEPPPVGMMIERMVRSGQQVYARQGDLVIVGGCSAGSELIADGNIHVYGPLRGRAICGINGNKASRIFCSSLEAELVSVAGVYRLLEEIPEDIRGKPAQIAYDGDQLTIQGIGKS